MAKASITRKYVLNAKGILDITDSGVFIENPDTGEMADLNTLLEDFHDKAIKLSVTYDEDYE